MEAEAAATRDSPPPGTDLLAQGDDRFTLKINFDARQPRTGYPSYEDTSYKASISPSWNAIFASVAPSMINEASEFALNQAFKDFLTKESLRRYQSRKEFKGRGLRNFRFHKDEIETCIVQLRALGLISESKNEKGMVERAEKKVESVGGLVAYVGFGLVAWGRSTWSRRKQEKGGV